MKTGHRRGGQGQTDRFGHSRYLVRARRLRRYYGSFHIYSPEGELAFYIWQKSESLQPEIRVYADESMQRELLCLSKNVFKEFVPTYDVHDSSAEEHVGTITRSVLKSAARLRWEVIDGDGNVIAEVQEDSLVKGILRRVFRLPASMGPLLLMRYHMTVGGTRTAEYREHSNPLIYELGADFSGDRFELMDRRLGIAAAILISITHPPGRRL